jgi:FtsP/CotA-like multicopper oxidase with cupredoxin domain
MGPTRREFLRIAGGALVVSGVASVGRRFEGLGSAEPAARFTQPEVLTSANGRLDIELVAAPAKVPFGPGTRFAYTYNGTTPGPTLRVRPGDVLSITLENRLGETTNLHTHGLHVSPSGVADNIFVSVPDHDRRTYTYEIPADHRSGTFWYHPHRHGTVARQVFGGLAGVIVVEDTIDAAPELVGATERLLVLSDPVIGSSSAVLDVSMMQEMQGREGDRVLVNGVAQPTISVQAGTLEHWRVLNASSSRYYRLALEGHSLHMIGTDSGRLATPVAVTDVLLAPGERVELLAAPSKAGSYALRSLPYDRGGMGMGMGMGSSSGSSRRTTLARVVVNGDAPAAGMPPSLAAPTSLALPDATSRRELVLAMGMGGSMGDGNSGMSNRAQGMGRTFTIDGESFDASRTDIVTALGRVEDWTLTNTSPMDHPFHLHVWPFQIVARSDGKAITPGWKDTVNVPAGGSVTVRIPLTEISGRTVYHCHILDHEDLGMMGVIDVR